MPATFTTASSAPNSSTSSANSARTASSSVTEMFDARACPPASTMRSAVVRSAPSRLRRAVDRDAGVDGDDEHALATELLGDRGADPDRAARDDGDAWPVAAPLMTRRPPRRAPSPSKSPAARHSARRSRNRRSRRSRRRRPRCAGCSMLGLPSKFSREGVHAAMNALLSRAGAEDDVRPGLLGRLASRRTPSRRAPRAARRSPRCARRRGPSGA